MVHSISILYLTHAKHTETGELMGVLWFLLGVTGAHMNGLDWSKLPVDPFGLWLAGMKVFVSAGTFQWPFFWFSIFFLTGRSFKLYLRWFGSSGLQNDNSSGCLTPVKRLWFMSQFQEFVIRDEDSVDLSSREMELRFHVGKFPLRGNTSEWTKTYNFGNFCWLNNEIYERLVGRSLICIT